MLSIWRLELDDPAHLHSSRLACLDPTETMRWQRLRRDAQRFAAAHTALRFILARELACDASEIHYQTNPWGKPCLPHGPHFSLSHSQGVALIALQADAPLGVDIECHGQLESSCLDECCSPAELKRLQQPLSTEQALRLWVRKEAVLKALGRGLSLPMSQIALPQGDKQRMRALSVCEGQGQLWHVYDLDVGYGQLAALACRRSYAAHALKVKDYLP
jgi:4'-phosphopantetheinyl transferase